MAPKSLNSESDRQPVWHPSAERVANTNLTRFLKQVESKLAENSEVSSMASLHRWSVEEPAAFWSEVWDFTEIHASKQPTEIIDDPSRMPGASWFSGSRLNYAENLLVNRYPQARRSTAIVSWNENGRYESLTWDELRDEVKLFAAALRQAGVSEGDRVAGFLPNIPEAVVAMLATSSVGALWSSCSPDFGVDGVMERFGQFEPKILVCARGALWNGAWIDALSRVASIAKQIPSLSAVVIADYGSEAGGNVDRIPHARTWNDFVSPIKELDLAFAQLPFDHPLYILYSSGTTGKPKCIVHGQGGTLIQHLKELKLHADVRAGDAVFYYTTCGWMMWNWVVSTLALDATLVLFDGSPFHATETRMWDLVDQEELTVLGTSAKYLAMAEKRGLAPRQTHDLGSLRTILSTGSVLPPESFDWVYSKVKGDVHLASISGGTDLVSCLVLGDPSSPVYRGEIQTAGLGMRVDVWNSEAMPLSPGEKGDLVCSQAFPSMPIGFWDDPGQVKYRSAYFEHTARPAWRHGDWIERTENGGFIIHGRSDTTLNPGGVRIGTAEIYRPVERLEAVLESVAVGQEWEGDERVILFVVLRDRIELDSQLEQRIRSEIRECCSPRHIPALILAVPAIPRTISGKKSEIAVRRLIHDMPLENVDALANPEALTHFRNLPALVN